MDKERTFTKLSLLVNDSFTIEKVNEYVFKRFNPQTMKMETSQDWQKDFQKKYPTLTDRGELDLSAAQLASLLEACSYGGKADVVGKTFEVKSNGKTGIEIRYFFNVVKDKEVRTEESDKDEVYDIEGERIDPSEIPF